MSQSEAAWRHELEQGYATKIESLRAKLALERERVRAAEVISLREGDAAIALRDDLVESRAELARMAEELRSIEWSGTLTGLAGHLLACCPDCRAALQGENNHRRDCNLAALLTSSGASALAWLESQKREAVREKEAELVAAKAARAEMMEALRTVQWNATSMRCPACNGISTHGHFTSSCFIAMLLERGEEAHERWLKDQEVLVARRAVEIALADLGELLYEGKIRWSGIAPLEDLMRAKLQARISAIFSPLRSGERGGEGLLALDCERETDHAHVEGTGYCRCGNAMYDEPPPLCPCGHRKDRHGKDVYGKPYCADGCDCPAYEGDEDQP